MIISRRQACSILAAAISTPAFGCLARPASRQGTPGSAAFLEAVRAGNTPRVRELLSTQPSLAGARDDAGRSPIILAFQHGHEATAIAIRSHVPALDIVEAFFFEDWDRLDELSAAHPELLHQAHPVGGTPLYGAALVGSIDSWRLRAAGCTYDAAPAGGTGFTPARGAMESPHPDWAMIGLTDLCSNGSDINAPQPRGSSVLHGAVARRDARLVRLALRKGADFTARDAQGRTARELAPPLGWPAGAALLANPERVPQDNRSSRFALDANREPIERLDLSDVPQATQSAVTASSHGQLNKVREFIERDPRLVFSISTDDELAIEACAHTGARPVIRFHLDHGAPLSLPTAVSLGDFETVEFWLRQDSTLIHGRGAHDFPLMWYAVVGGRSVEMAELLHHHGASLDQESMGATALHWCVKRSAIDLAKWLLETGATPNPVGFRWSRQGETPLEIAQASGNDAMTKLLRENGG